MLARYALWLLRPWGGLGEFVWECIYSDDPEQEGDLRFADSTEPHPWRARLLYVDDESHKTEKA